MTLNGAASGPVSGGARIGAHVCPTCRPYTKGAAAKGGFESAISALLACKGALARPYTAPLEARAELRAFRGSPRA